MNLIRYTAAFLVLSEVVGAQLVGSDLSGALRSRSSILSKRAKKPVSIILVVVVAAVVIAVIIGLVAIVYLCHRKRNREKKVEIDYGMGYISTPNARGSVRAEGDWWQPPDTMRNSIITTHSTFRPEYRNSSYSSGGQGYTYGMTVDHRSSRLSNFAPTVHSHTDNRVSTIDHRSSRLSDFSPTVRSHGDNNSSVNAANYQGEAFQMPVAPYSRVQRPTSLSPLYHTEAAGGEVSAEASPTSPVVPPQQPPAASHSHPPVRPLEPQYTGTSMYSSPYEVTAMTKSTSGHPGT